VDSRKNLLVAAGLGAGLVALAVVVTVVGERTERSATGHAVGGEGAGADAAVAALGAEAAPVAGDALERAVLDGALEAALVSPDNTLGVRARWSERPLPTAPGDARWLVCPAAVVDARLDDLARVVAAVERRAAFEGADPAGALEMAPYRALYGRPEGADDPVDPRPARAADRLGPGPLPYPGGPAATPGDATARLVAVIDTDGDGQISAAEFALMAPPFVQMATFDADRSGALAPAEVEAMLATQNPLIAMDPGSARQEGPVRPGGPRR